MFCFFRDSFSYVRVDGRVFEEIGEVIVNDSSTIGSFYARLGIIVFTLRFAVRLSLFAVVVTLRTLLVGL